jgi:Ni/Fe-hydrogenase subunit HybB-like protein
MAVIFLILYFQMNIYPWMNETTRWLNPNSFIFRNFVLLVISFLFAHFYTRASLKNKSYRGILAVLFLLSFVITQSLVAVDWVMSLEYPWMSTMFAPLFFVESFYAGLAIGAIMSVIFLAKKRENSDEIKKVMRDMALFMFGFALAWAGLYYGQYLVIWYGNIPWETSYFAKRMHNSPYNVMMYLIIFILFILPFLGFLGQKSKTMRMWILTVSILVLAGILIERIFYIMPVLSVNPVFSIAEFILIGFLFYLFALNRNKIIASN